MTRVYESPYRMIETWPVRDIRVAWDALVRPMVAPHGAVSSWTPEVYGMLPPEQDYPDEATMRTDLRLWYDNKRGVPS